jgi:LysM repeat protein
MINRSLSSSVLCALTFAFVAAPLLSNAQTPAAPADASSTNAAPAPAPTPAPAPAPTPAPADTTATTTERPTTYTMVAGDSLDSIAKKFDTSIHALAKLNKIPKEKYRKLRAGTVLQIPPAKPETTTK